MKNFFRVVLPILAAFACTDHNMPCTPNDDLWANPAEVTITIGRTLCNPSNGYGVRFTAVNDSRCPTGVYCFLAGEGKATIDVLKDEQTIETTELVIDKPVTISVGGSNFTVTLKAINPYPNPVDQPKKVRHNIVLQVHPE